MNPLEIVHFLEELIRSETKVIAFSVVSVGITLGAVYILRKWVFPKGDSEKESALKNAEIARKDADIARKDSEIGNLERKLEDRERKIAAGEQLLEQAEHRHQREKSAFQQQNAELSKACEDLKDENVELASNTASARLKVEQSKKDYDLFYRRAVTAVTKYKVRAQALEGQINQIEQKEGRFWESPVGSAPPFRTLNPTNATIIAVTNLKGGVGKTSLTANIAATYWKMGKRVLVVDLDHQASLTFLCLSPEQIKDLAPGGGKFVQNVLKASANHAAAAWNNLMPINSHGSCILAASEELITIEEQVKARWLLNPNGFDLRFILRAALHDSMIQERFDIILLDCPPRLTPASINAMTCSDFVLIPALLDRTSTEAVPRLLNWLRGLKNQGVSSDLSVLGVVGNRAHSRTKLSIREKNVWTELQVTCNDIWGTSVPHFETHVPTSAQFAEAAAKREFAAFHPKLEKIFTKLVAEIEKRRVQHESSRVTAAS